MALFLDSASVSDAQRAMSLGFVAGITTNPNLMSQTGRKPEDVISELGDICPGPIFYQLSAASVEAREDEGRAFLTLRANVALKIAMSTENLALAAKFSREGVTVGMTATYSAAQTYLACEAGVAYSIAYVNRSTRLQGDGLTLVGEMRDIVDAGESTTRILVASLKSEREVIDAVIAGAHDVTIPITLMMAMGNHHLSEQAIEEFARASHQCQTGL